MEVLRAAHNELHIAALMNIEATSDVQNLMQRNSAVKKLLTEKGKEVEEWSGISKLAKEKAKATAAPIKDLMEERKSDPAYDTFFLALPENVPGEEMEEEVSAEKARLELTHEGNGNVIKEYEQRQQRVDLLKQEMEEGKGAFDDLAEQIKSVRDRWEPELDKLVEKISRSFSFNMSQINCAGEVSVFKDDFDFDAWAIQILVKFRFVTFSKELTHVLFSLSLFSLPHCVLLLYMIILPSKSYTADNLPQTENPNPSPN